MAHMLSRLRVWLSCHVSPQTMRAIRPFLTLQFFIFMFMGIINTAILVITATLLDIITNLILSPQSAVSIFIINTRLNFIIGYIVFP